MGLSGRKSILIITGVAREWGRHIVRYYGDEAADQQLAGRLGVPFVQVSLPR